MTNTEKQLLLKALTKARRLLKDGKRWIKGEYHRQGKGYCLLGAIAECETTLIEHVHGAIPRYVNDGNRVDRVIEYNDAPRRTWNQIKAVLDKTERSIRGQK